MDAALLGMLAAVLASVFDQRRESAKTRDAIQLLSTQVAGLAATNTAHSRQLVSRLVSSSRLFGGGGSMAAVGDDWRQLWARGGGGRRL